ncbi:hypothetical protein [Mucilaginibacter sp.]|uniref:hypothetical protein n=1 Tax=Mucilaginibacter sp. TaxID=1882438 RepID=UPI003B009103
MKPVEHAISDASFVGHYYKILLSKLKQFKTAKHVVLISMVLLCILVRYLVLSMDKSPVKIQSITEKQQKPKAHVSKPAPNSAAFSQDDFSGLKQAQYNFVQTDASYFLINEAQ